MRRLLLSPLLLAFSLTFSDAAEVRVWKTVRGQMIEGSFVKAEGDKVVLLRKNSKETVAVPREELMPTDTIYLDQLEKQNKAAPVPATPGKPAPSS